MNQNFDPEWAPTPEETAPAQPMSEVEIAVEKSNIRSTYSRLGWYFTLVTLVWIIASSLAFSVITSISPEAANTAWANVVAGTLPLYALSTPLLWLLVKQMPCENDLQERKPLSISHFLILFIIAQALMVGGSLIGNGWMSVLSNLTGINFENSLEQTFEMPLWLSGLLTVVLAPVFEELIFRKLLLDRMIPHGSAVAILVSGLLFGLFHGNFYQFFYAALLGCLLSFVYVRTRRIHHCILLHAAVNFVGGIIPTMITNALELDILESLTDEAEIAEHLFSHAGAYLASMVYMLFQYGAAIAGVVLLVIYFKRLVVARREHQLPVKKAFWSSLGNPGMIVAILSCALMFAMSLLSALVPAA